MVSGHLLLSRMRDTTPASSGCRKQAGSQLSLVPPSLSVSLLPLFHTHVWMHAHVCSELVLVARVTISVFYRERFLAEQKQPLEDSWAWSPSPGAGVTTVLTSSQGDPVQVQAHWLPVAWPLP
jgi:hypothetical protein